MKDVGIERAASNIHRLIAHGLKTRFLRRAEPVSTGSLGSPVQRGSTLPTTPRKIEGKQAPQALQQQRFEHSQRHISYHTFGGRS